MDITHIITNGCSFTYCQGLDNIKEQGWPNLVAKELGVPVVNLALPGVGNDSIARRTYEYIYETLPDNSKPLVIIAWSQYWRREAWYEVMHGKEAKHYHPVALPNNKPSDTWEEALLDHWNEEDFYRKTVLYKLMLQNLFKAYQIPFLMSEYSAFNSMSSNWEYFYDKVHNEFPVMCDKAENSEHWLKPFYEITTGYPPASDGHDGPEAQIALAKYVVDEIKNRFGEIRCLNQKFTSLREYREKHDANAILKFNAWL